jgi:hypothetical protein
MMTDLNEYLTLKEFCERYSSIVSIGGLRWILFNAKFNGADCFVRKLGRRKLLISPKLFLSWLESNKRGASNQLIGGQHG